MRLATLGVLILGVLAAGPSQQSAPPAKPDETWPPVGIETLKPRIGVTPPRLRHEVKPSYTEAAVRARLQGTVTLQCVVQIDGTVGAIHVTQSLDSKYGLDEAAIAALRQWRFAPATKDGVAVPVIVRAELAFSLRDRAPTLTWPDGFAATQAAEPGPGQWHEDVTEIAGLRIRVTYPDGWTLRKNGRDNEIVDLRKGASFSRVSIARPTPVPYSLDGPVLADQLRQVGERIREANAARGLALEPLALGQAPAPIHTWAWYAYKTSNVPAPDVPPAAAAAAQEMFDGMRVWVFVATAGGQAVLVTCTAMVARGTSDAGKADALAARSAEIGAIVRQMTIDVR